MSMVDKIAELITLMAMVGEDQAKQNLRNDARSHTVEQWKRSFKIKTTSVGVLTGLAPGVSALILEIPDLAYLFAATGRGCYGIGYILRDEVDYDNDMAKILALWCGMARASNDLVQGSAIALRTKAAIGAKLAGAGLVTAGLFNATIVIQTIGPKFMGKVAAKAASKVMAKALLRMSARWTPVFGSLVSGGVNYWIASSLMNAAELYYLNEYIIFNKEYQSELTT
jgi:hypothetical protein